MSHVTAVTMLAQAVETSDERQHGIIITLVLNLFIGLIAGFLASKVINKSGEGMFRDIILGLVGAFVGGQIIHLFGIHREGRIIMSIVVATLGAILVLFVYHKLIRPAGRGGPMV